MLPKIKDFTINHTPEVLESRIRSMQGLIANYPEPHNVSKDDDKIIIMQSANYGNLGDIAITEAQKTFLKFSFPNHKIIEVPLEDTYKSIPTLKRIINSSDIITTTGGGFMGSLYYGAEKQRNYIIKNFPNNRVVCFPQTIYLHNTLLGRVAKRRMTKTYNQHEDLHLLARDRPSYKVMKKLFPNNKVYLTPDIALLFSSPGKKIFKNHNLNVGICIRDDKESGLDSDSIDIITQSFNQSTSFTHFDTHIGDVTITPQDRMGNLKKLWNTIKSCDVVVTDRLHGMIFCAIVNTPCIAIDNSNGKVGDVYATWIKQLGGVEYVREVTRSSITSAIKKLSSNKPRGTKLLNKDIQKISNIIIGKDL